MPSYARHHGNFPYTQSLYLQATGDYVIDYDGFAGFNNAVGSGGYNYAQEASDSEVSIVSSAGVTYTNDPLSASLQTLTWAHGEAGIKYIKLYHSALGDNMEKQYRDWPEVVTDIYRWYAVYLTFDHSLQMGLSASTTSIDTSWRYGNTIVPTACATIANLSHGRGTNSHNTDLNTAFKGGSATPFFVGISGFQDSSNRDNYCYTDPGY
jgi:hypothetical protein